MPEADYGRPSIDDWFVVEDAEQARILSDLTSFRYFEPFLGRERSVAEAADELGCRLDTMLYRVRTFLSAGLLVVTGLRKRRGRPVKRYRSVADALFVPFEVTPYATLEDRLANQMQWFNEQVIRSSAQLLRQSGRDGRRIFRRENGEVWNDSAADTATPFSLDDHTVPAAYDFTTTLELEAGAARSLQRELHELFLKYAERAPVPGGGSEQGRPNEGGRGRPRGQTYLWQIVLLPAAAD